MAKFLKSIYVWLPLVMLWTVSACAIQKTAQQSNQPTNFTINSPEGNIQIVLSNENNQVREGPKRFCGPTPPREIAVDTWFP